LSAVSTLLYSGVNRYRRTRTGGFSIGTARTLKETVSGTPVLEKQSRFLACGTPISSGDDPKELIKILSKNYRLKKASHISWAVRLVDGTEIRNDGGESGAGNCILETMRETNTVSCLVVVARWYGGKHLGGLRFRIYRRATAELISDFSSPL